MSSLAKSVSRRQFLGSASLALAGGHAQRQLVAAESHPLAANIKKAVKWHMITEPLSDADKLKMVRELGFDGVETHSSLRSNAPDIAGLARASERTGVPVHGVVNSSNPDIKTAIDDAKMLGATSVLHVVRYDRQKPYQQNYAETQQILRDAIPHAEKQEVSILIENVWASFLIEPMMTARYIDELDSPWVQLYFDIGNVVRWGWPEHWLQVVGKRAKKLDVKEYDLNKAMNEGMRNGFKVPIGQGSIDWAAVRKELRGLEYQGWATAEVSGGDRKRLAQVSEEMDQVLSLKTS